MNRMLGNTYSLHYKDQLERSGRISGTILIIIGLIFLVGGLKNIIAHIRIRTTKYTVVPGKVIAWDKKTSHVKMSRKTDYYPTMEFEYEGATHKIRSKKSFGEESMTAFTTASKDGQFEVRVPIGDLQNAIPNYDLDRNEKLRSDIWECGFGLVIIAIGVFFIASRHR